MGNVISFAAQESKEHFKGLLRLTTWPGAHSATRFVQADYKTDERSQEIHG